MGDAGSKRNKGSKSNSKMDPRKDRKKIMADLFNDSDSSDKEESSTSSSTNLLNELEEKRNRMKSKLKTSGGENIKKKNSTREEVSKMFNMTTSTTSNPSSSKSQSIHAVRRQRNEEDEKFIASDNSSLSESELSDADSETEAEDRRKRLDVRKKKKGGDVLAWMSRRAKVSVIVQTSARAYIQDMAQYRMRLLAEGDSEDSDVPSSTSRRSRKSSGEEKTPKSRMSTSSDDSIPRGKIRKLAFILLLKISQLRKSFGRLLCIKNGIKCQLPPPQLREKLILVTPMVLRVQNTKSSINDLPQ